MEMTIHLGVHMVHVDVESGRASIHALKKRDAGTKFMVDGLLEQSPSLHGERLPCLKNVQTPSNLDLDRVAESLLTLRKGRTSFRSQFTPTVHAPLHHKDISFQVANGGALLNCGYKDTVEVIVLT